MPCLKVEDTVVPEAGTKGAALAAPHIQRVWAIEGVTKECGTNNSLNPEEKVALARASQWLKLAIAQSGEGLLTARYSTHSLLCSRHCAGRITMLPSLCSYTMLFLISCVCFPVCAFIPSPISMQHSSQWWLSVSAPSHAAIHNYFLFAGTTLATQWHSCCSEIWKEQTLASTLQ